MTYCDGKGRSGLLPGERSSYTGFSLSGDVVVDGEAAIGKCSALRS